MRTTNTRNGKDASRFLRVYSADAVVQTNLSIPPRACVIHEVFAHSSCRVDCLILFYCFGDTSRFLMTLVHGGTGTECSK